ncbi:arsenate reductase (thioredoxin) [Kurthia sibirica]|uniref:Arsenate reductase n=1 Tax=Kurthia sibirica TaxID=202750 RepID=A0A2U3AN35_9BACL|nr:arsenate reductase (thioredoxin) [Kurthia sibirica]PWI25937.1 arsenate reductase (thioredoxin) [Kurthia sibirica]GEK35141.1 protein ArsC [Kurthia sibirica]
MTKTIYFLCTGNSCRSQMSEGWAKKILPTDWQVKSAGIQAHGVNPQAIKAMAEVGIDISHQTSDLVAETLLKSATLIVTLCGDAADKCPVTPPTVRREHWGFEDPAKAQGTAEERWLVFQNVRDAIGERLEQFRAELNV